jgi:COMPASS component SWD3
MSVMFSHQSNMIVSGGFDESIKVWDVKGNGSAKHTLPGHTGVMRWVQHTNEIIMHRVDPVSCVAFDNNDEFIVSGSFDGSIRFWSVASGQVPSEWFGGCD